MATEWLHDAELHVNLLCVIIELIDNLNGKPFLEFAPEKLLSWFVNTHIQWLESISASLVAPKHVHFFSSLFTSFKSTRNSLCQRALWLEGTVNSA